MESLRRPESKSASPADWLWIGAILTFLYMIFGIVLIGVPAISRGGIVTASLIAFWAGFGVVTGRARFPPALSLAVAFYVMVLLSGFMVKHYPFEYIGQVTTIWISALGIAIFAANGMSLRIVLAGFVIVFVANMIAIAVGYDGYLENVAAPLEAIRYKAGTPIVRYSGLAGQSNLLVSLNTAPLFLMFLRKRRIDFPLYLLLLSSAIAIAVLTGSRSAIFIALAFAVLAVLFLVESPMVRKVAPLVIAALVAYGLYFASESNPILKVEQSDIGEMTVIERLIESIDGVDGSANERRALIDSAWQPFYAKPFFGYGPDMFKDVIGRGLYAHNSFAEIQVNFGLVGLALWYGMYLVTVAGILRSPYKAPALCVLVYLILMDQWFVAYLDRALVMTLCLLLVFCGRSLLKRSRRSHRMSGDHAVG